MNPRTFGSITVVTTIFLGLVHALFGTNVTLFDFLWQDLIAVLFVVILARETGSIQSEDSKPVSLVINNKMDEAFNAQMYRPMQPELNSSTMQSISNVFDKLADRLESLEKSLELRQISYVPAVAAPAVASSPAEPVSVVHSSEVNTRNTVKLINKDIPKPKIPKAKQIMLQKILNENINMQKKAS